MAPAACISPQHHASGTALTAAKSLPGNITIEPITSATVPAYRRLLSLLLPIRYPDKFYHDAIENAASRTIALCALWQDSAAQTPTVIAGIQCRHFNIPIDSQVSSSSTSLQTNHPPSQETLYIQTLATLAPYRSLGVATALLEAVIKLALQNFENVSSIHAHVWELNVDAMEWYQKRGFDVEAGIVEGYYRKLRPAGARIVRKRLCIGDHLRAKAETVLEGNVKDLGEGRANG